MFFSKLFLVILHPTTPASLLSHNIGKSQKRRYNISHHQKVTGNWSKHIIEVS